MTCLIGAFDMSFGGWTEFNAMGVVMALVGNRVLIARAENNSVSHI